MMWSLAGKKIISCIDTIFLISSSIETFGLSKNLFEMAWQLDFFFLSNLLWKSENFEFHQAHTLK